ncbi:MAG: hypothetical protein UZ06_CHB003001214 [Chlorobi bacterium OLB6]|nr:MAG: hypothetical protein UZ06_CHB003001214 [Chlorobi bacterium OLB6]
MVLAIEINVWLLITTCILYCANTSHTSLLACRKCTREEVASNLNLVFVTVRYLHPCSTGSSNRFHRPRRRLWASRKNCITRYSSNMIIQSDFKTSLYNCSIDRWCCIHIKVKTALVKIKTTKFNLTKFNARVEYNSTTTSIILKKKGVGSRYISGITRRKLCAGFLSTYSNTNKHNYHTKHSQTGWNPQSVQFFKAIIAILQHGC